MSHVQELFLALANTIHPFHIIKPESEKDKFKMKSMKSHWKRSRTKRLSVGEHEANSKYYEYRKNLNHVITLAKETFSQKKILDNVNNHKKTWAAINQLRGKNKESMRVETLIYN